VVLQVCCDLQPFVHAVPSPYVVSRHKRVLFRLIVVDQLAGHGNAINEIRFFPNDPDICLTCSKDHSIRMWNIKTRVTIAVFSGENGHCDDVLSMVRASPHSFGWRATHVQT
jgi:WD40 repeat protein